LAEKSGGADTEAGLRRAAAPTLVDVARIAGVSVSTAGRVMRDSGWPVDAGLKERVREAAVQVGYVPNILARTLRGSAPALIGLVAGNMLDPYYGEIADAVTRHAEASHKMLAMVCNMQRDPTLELKYCRQLWEHRVAGLILAGGGFDQITHHDELAAILRQMVGSGVVVTTLSPRGVDAPSFCVDNRRVGQMAAAELIEHGHRHVGIIMGQVRNEVRRQRLEAMVETFAASGITPAICDVNGDEGAAVAAFLRTHPDVTGIVSSTHAISVGIINAVRRSGRIVPDEISVVAIGNAKLAEWSMPRLTHIDLNLEDCGRAALDHIAVAVSGKLQRPWKSPLPRLIRGESVVGIVAG
jgi:LacI family transcriptional regulator